MNKMENISETSEISEQSERDQLLANYIDYTYVFIIYVFISIFNEPKRFHLYNVTTAHEQFVYSIINYIL